MRQTVLVRGLIGALCLGAAVLVLMIVTGSEFDETAGRAILTAIALAFFSLAALAGRNLAERRPELWALGRLAALSSVLALLAVVVSIWASDGESWEIPTSLAVVAFALGHASVLLAGAREDDGRGVRALRRATLGALAILVGLALIEIATDSETIGPRAPAVVAVAYVLGTILLPLLRRAPRPAPAPDLDAQQTEPALRLVWSGSVESAAERLRAHGFEVEVGPDVGRSRDGIPIVRSARPPRHPPASR